MANIFTDNTITLTKGTTTEITLITSPSTPVLLPLRATSTVLTVSLSVRLPVPENLYTTEILMQ